MTKGTKGRNQVAGARSNTPRSRRMRFRGAGASSRRLQGGWRRHASLGPPGATTGAREQAPFARWCSSRAAWCGPGCGVIPEAKWRTVPSGQPNRMSIHSPRSSPLTLARQFAAGVAVGGGGPWARPRRWLRILRITGGSRMKATTLIGVLFEPLGQRRGSASQSPNRLARRSASSRLARAGSR